MHSLLSTLNKPTTTIPQDEIARYCKYANHLKVLRYTPIEESLSEQNFAGNKSDIQGKLEEGDSVTIYYLLLRAVDGFFGTYKRYPGVHEEEVDGDVGLFKKEVVSMMNALGVSSTLITDDYIQDVYVSFFIILFIV